MEKVQFTVTLTPCTPTVAGADRVTYQFSPNPGEPLQPLTEIASGGEMSRFLLALKACLSQVDVAGTMVFDEIDVGVSGRVTQAIADKLHQLSRRHQVLCVTHQPIVAAKADHHYRVSKQVIGDGQREPTSNDTQAQDDVRTVVRVSPLNAEQRLEELAQLAGGKTDQEAIAFARSLLDRATQTNASEQNASEQNASEQNGSRQNASRQHASGQNDAGQDSAAIFSPVEPDLSNSDTPSKTTKSKQKTTSRTRKKRSQA
jgi:DNA repair protein RecN (Recombination protein N)